MANKITKYAVTVMRGDGVRGTKKVFLKKSDAKKYIENLSSRSDADTRNPRIKKYLGFK